jgi:hypothetical protein
MGGSQAGYSSADNAYFHRDFPALNVTCSYLVCLLMQNVTLLAAVEPVDFHRLDMRHVRGLVASVPS